jgi:hypothetical protein
MQKLKLALDDLSVTSFDLTPKTEQPSGTVAAHELAPTRQTRCETCRTLCLPYC